MKTLEQQAKEFQEKEYAFLNGKGGADQLQKAFIVGGKAILGELLPVLKSAVSMLDELSGSYPELERDPRRERMNEILRAYNDIIK